jgi:hypothetical protein
VGRAQGLLRGNFSKMNQSSCRLGAVYLDHLGILMADTGLPIHKYVTFA